MDPVTCYFIVSAVRFKPIFEDSLSNAHNPRGISFMPDNVDTTRIGDAV